ncbi:MAG: hypothetical protein IIB16_01070 [Chloroflexi bacterium]|nr:hypothetical protein [Chloroflexota bacterium]
MEKRLKLYVAPKLKALGKIESITNAISCTGFANKSGPGFDDMSEAMSLGGTAQCL